MLRIIAGTARGRRIQAPEGRDTRPTLDRVRENLFNMLQGRLTDARTLDLFAGSGTTAAVAAGLGRRFLCCDCSPVAMHVLRKRLLERDNAISMLEAQEDFLLEYPASGAAFTIEAEWDGKSCTLHAVSEEDTALLVAYCAIGDLKEGAFDTHAHAFYPPLPLTLKAEGLTDPALQVGLVDGRQGFFRL